MLEVCAGSGRLSTSCRRLGISAFQWDVKYRAGMDLTQVSAQRRIRHWIRNRELDFLWASPPSCSALTLPM
eukprot:6370183-Amphidinium_carterae.1